MRVKPTGFRQPYEAHEIIQHRSTHRNIYYWAPSTAVSDSLLCFHTLMIIMPHKVCSVSCLQDDTFSSEPIEHPPYSLLTMLTHLNQSEVSSNTSNNFQCVFNWSILFLYLIHTTRISYFLWTYVTKQVRK